VFLATGGPSLAIPLNQTFFAAHAFAAPHIANIKSKKNSG